MRLFVAAYPPEHVCAHLGAAVDGLAVSRAVADGVNTRLAPRSNWHITLAFLGDVPDDRGEVTAAAVSAAVPRWRANAGAPPGLRLAGGGRFGRGRFTILWVGVDGEVDALRTLTAAVRKELKRARLPYDPKPLRPHVTLARPGDRVDVRDDVAALAGYAGPDWTVDELRVMRSYPGPKPRYERIADIPLS